MTPEEEDALFTYVILHIEGYMKYKKIFFRNMLLNYGLVLTVFLVFCYALWIHSSWWVIGIIVGIILFLLYALSYISERPKSVMRNHMLTKAGENALDKFLKKAPRGTFKTDKIHELYNLIDEDELIK